jgi:hypothetical protein
VISNAVTVMKIATGEIEEAVPTKSAAAMELGRLGGLARAKKLSRAKRVSIARAGGLEKSGKAKMRR